MMAKIKTLTEGLNNNWLWLKIITDLMFVAPHLKIYNLRLYPTVGWHWKTGPFWDRRELDVTRVEPSWVGSSALTGRVTGEWLSFSPRCPVRTQHTHRLQPGKALSRTDWHSNLRYPASRLVTIHSYCL